MILCTEKFNGKAHDGTIFKSTTRLNPEIMLFADSGYRGIQKVHSKTQIPIRHKEDIAKLSEAGQMLYKMSNKAIASIRMKVEHIIGRIKRFKIVAEKYRNRLKRMLLRFNLVCGIVNYELLC